MKRRKKRNRKRKTMRSSVVSRRQFLRGLGGVAVGLPLLASNLETSLFAQEAPGSMTPDGYPRRFLFFFHPNGVMPDDWWPSAGANERDFSLVGTSLEPLEPFREKLNLARGINMQSPGAGPGEPHQTGMGGILTGRPLQEGTFVGGDGSLAGWGDGISIDQAIANHVSDNTSLKSLELGVRADANAGSEVRSRLSYTGPAQPIPPINDPREAFDLIFSDMNTDPEMLAQIRAKRASVLDTVTGQFEGVRSRIGTEDRERFDAHFTMVRELETRLQNEGVVPGTCDVPNRPADMAPDDENTMPDVTQSQVDLMTLAFICDITRVGVIQFSNSKNHIRFPWLDSMGDGHQLSHAGPSNQDARTQWNKRDTWFAEQLAYIMAQLDRVPEGDGTMLDNTFIWWGNELAQGNTHSHNTMPFVFGGSAGGVFETGRLIEYAEPKSHNDLLISIGNAYGLDIDTFGDQRFCTGPLPGFG